MCRDIIFSCHTQSAPHLHRLVEIYLFHHLRRFSDVMVHFKNQIDSDTVTHCFYIAF